nr:PREDICTED: uncharacterized protein LOC100881497 isoform X2 [Megachile rotundata]
MGMLRTSLQLLRLDVPSIADPRWDKVVLRCEYDLGGEDLYSVKWYKDGCEFFRYMPDSKPPGREFPVPGVHVDLNKSDNKQVTLFGQNSLIRAGKVNLAGSYGCEVSSEAPSFQTIYGEANMSVAIPPKEPPSLHGLRPSYEAGETLFAECTSAPSYPPALLAFILNGKEVNKALTKELPSGSTSEESMVSSSRLRLTLRLERHHFPGGTLSLSCQSTLPGVAGTRPLERTETATLAANNQRLAQEPPRSAAGLHGPLSANIVCIMAILRSASLW